VNDPLSAYIDMGMPKRSAPRNCAVQQQTADRPEQDKMLRVGTDGQATVSVTMRSNDIALVTLEPVIK
jgi:xylan 1,4-beta-xylosidase